MPLEVFYCYSHKDEELRNQLETHLTLLQRNGFISQWHDRRIGAGQEWAQQIDEHVRSAQIILLLVSPDFLASDYCYDVEMKLALERHAREHAIVIPVILRPCDWSAAPFGRFQALPRDAKAVTLWSNQDEAFAEIARAIRETAVRFEQPPPAPAPFVDLPDRMTPKPRVLDAAMPSHIVKDRPTELRVLIRLPESPGLVGILQADDEAEARPADVRSKPFDVVFPLGPTGRPEPLKVTIKIIAPDFLLPSDHENVFVPVDADSQECFFVLTPKRTGSLMVVIELTWEDAARGYRRLRANCVSEAESAAIKPVMNVVQMPVGVAPSEGKLESTAFAVGPRVPLPPAMKPAIAPPAPSPSPSRSAPKPSFLSSPLLKAAVVAVCVISFGTFFAVQRNGKAPPMVPSAPPPVSTPTQEASAATIDNTAAEFDRVSRPILLQREGAPTAVAPAALNPEVTAALKTGQDNLTAALAKGQKKEAAQHLEQVRLATSRLRAIPMENKPLTRTKEIAPSALQKP